MPLFTQTPRFTNTREVFLAFQSMLRSKLADIFPEEAVLLADPELWENGPPEPRIATSFLTICPGDSTAPDDVQTGGGTNTTEEFETLEVTIFSDSRLDSTGSFPAAVYDENEGLFELKRRVLVAMCQADPTGDNQLPLLSAFTFFISWTKPRRFDSTLLFIKLVFGTQHFWDLS